MKLRRDSLYRALLTMALIAVLVIGFIAYLQPGFMFDLANRLSMC